MSSISLAKHFKIGCGDNSCRWGSPGGMATNGGCRCTKFADQARSRISSAEYQKVLLERIQLVSGISALRTILQSEDMLKAVEALVEAVVERRESMKSEVEAGQ